MLGRDVAPIRFPEHGRARLVVSSYQIIEVARLHYQIGQQTPHAEMTPYPIGLGANSQVIYNTRPSFLAQFGRPAGSTILAEVNATAFHRPCRTRVTGDGRFAEVGYAINTTNANTGLRWWDGFKWIPLMDEVSRSPTWVHGVNERGDVAFEYLSQEQVGSRAGVWSGAAQSWLPIFPEATTRAYVLSMNSNGVCCGAYRAANGQAAAFCNRAACNSPDILFTSGRSNRTFYGAEEQPELEFILELRQTLLLRLRI
jgi:hypothetical protein